MVIIVDGLERVDPLLAYFKQPQYEAAVSTQSYSTRRHHTIHNQTKETRGQKREDKRMR